MDLSDDVECGNEWGDEGLFTRVRKERIAGIAIGKGVNSTSLPKCVRRLGKVELDEGVNCVHDRVEMLY
jgi:hypothetical protein